MSELGTMVLAEIFDAVERMLRQAEDDERQPGEFTVQEYADHRGIGRDTAHSHLQKLQKKGRLSMRKAKIAGRLTNLYRLSQAGS